MGGQLDFRMLFEAAERRDFLLHLDSLSVAEAVSVLVGRYRRGRAEVVGALLTVIRSDGVATAEADVVTAALQRFAPANVDFADAWLAARATHLGHGVASFDRALNTTSPGKTD